MFSKFEDKLFFNFFIFFTYQPQFSLLLLFPFAVPTAAAIPTPFLFIIGWASLEYQSNMAYQVPVRLGISNYIKAGHIQYEEQGPISRQKNQTAAVPTVRSHTGRLRYTTVTYTQSDQVSPTQTPWLSVNSLSASVSPGQLMLWVLLWYC